MLTGLLITALIASLTATCIAIDKWREEKEWHEIFANAFDEEYEKRWNEIGLGLMADKEIEELKKNRDAALTDYMLAASKCSQETVKNMKLQDKLSATLCPQNNHVWQDGVCKRCGRIQPK